MSEVWSNGVTIVQSETWNADGTIHDIHYYGITGQAYTDYGVVYGANNKPVSASYSNGMTATWSYNARRHAAGTGLQRHHRPEVDRRPTRSTARTARP